MDIRVPKLLWMLPTGIRPPVRSRNAAYVPRGLPFTAEDNLTIGNYVQMTSLVLGRFRLSMRRLINCSLLRKQTRGVIYIELSLDTRHRGAHHLDQQVDDVGG